MSIETEDPTPGPLSTRELDTLCSYCRNFMAWKWLPRPKDDFSGGSGYEHGMYWEHHKSLVDLQECGNRGCKLCSFFGTCQDRFEDILWKDKGMPKGRLYTWEDMARMGRQSPGTCSGRKLACFLSVCLEAISNRRLKENSCAHKGLVTNWLHHNTEEFAAHNFGKHPLLQVQAEYD